MATRITSLGVIFNDSTQQTTQGVEFTSGTLMLFQQSAAPTGWTKQTTHNNKALRVVSGTAGSGGSVDFTSFATQTVVGSTTLSTAQMPSHTHTLDYREDSIYYRSDPYQPGLAPTPSAISTNATGGGGSHNHSINLDIKYVDLIIASKN